MSPAPSLLDDHIKFNQALKLALRRLSASTLASGDVGAIPGGTCLATGMAISWKSMQQPSAAAIIDKNDTREHSGDLSASAKKTKTADGAAVEDEARMPSAKASASAAADCLHAGIQQRLSQNNNLKTEPTTSPRFAVKRRHHQHQLRPLRRDDHQFRDLTHRHQQDLHVESACRF